MEIAFDFGPEIRSCRMKLECRFVVATQFLSHHTKNTNFFHQWQYLVILIYSHLHVSLLDSKCCDAH